MEIKFKIEGMKEIEESIKRAPFETAIELEKAIGKSIVKLANQTLKEAPVNKKTGGGNLRQNIVYGFRSRFSGIVESMAPYSEYVHEGTRPHIIRIKNKKGLANRRTGQYFGPVVNHPGTAPNPFMVRAADKVRDQINGYFDKVVENVTKLMNK